MTHRAMSSKETLVDFLAFSVEIKLPGAARLALCKLAVIGSSSPR